MPRPARTGRLPWEMCNVQSTCMMLYKYAEHEKPPAALCAWLKSDTSCALGVCAARIGPKVWRSVARSQDPARGRRVATPGVRLRRA